MKVLLFLFLLLMCLYLSHSIEPADLTKLAETMRLNTDDMMFIPYSDIPENNALNAYMVRPKRLIRPRSVENIADWNQTFPYQYIFDFPVNDERKSKLLRNFKTDKSIDGQFRPIITSSKYENERYKIEQILDSKLVNDPKFVYRDPRYLDNKILSVPSNKKDRLSTYINSRQELRRADTEFPRVGDDGFGNRFQCPWGFKYKIKNKDLPLRNSFQASISRACDFL